MPDQGYTSLPFTVTTDPIVPGTTWRFSFYLANDDKTRKNTTGYTFKMQFRERPNGPVTLEVSTANGKCVMTALQGQFDLTLAPADTLTLAPTSRLVFDSQLYDTVNTLPWMMGETEVKSPVTQ